jgi:hypothetical protein
MFKNWFLSAGGKSCPCNFPWQPWQAVSRCQQLFDYLGEEPSVHHEDLDNHRYKLQVSLDDMIRLRQLVSSKDSIIKDLRVSKRSVIQELEAARLAVMAAEDTSATLKAQRDKAMDKDIRAGRILMRRPGVIVPDDIVADVNAAPDSSSRSSSSVAPEKNITK